MPPGRSVGLTLIYDVTELRQTACPRLRDPASGRARAGAGAGPRNLGHIVWRISDPSARPFSRRALRRARRAVGGLAVGQRPKVLEGPSAGRGESFVICRHGQNE